MSTEENQQALLEKFVQQLIEHFDSVQIFVTIQESEGTDMATLQLNSGAGNWYARFGQVHEWLISHKHRIRLHVEQQLKDQDGD